MIVPISAIKKVNEPKIKLILKKNLLLIFVFFKFYLNVNNIAIGLLNSDWYKYENVKIEKKNITKLNNKNLLSFTFCNTKIKKQVTFTF